MFQVVKHIQEQDLTGGELTDLLQGKAKVVAYEDFVGPQGGIPLLERVGKIALLFPVESNSTGHWLGIWIRPQEKRLVHFDPYGFGPEAEMKYTSNPIVEQRPLTALYTQAQAEGWSISVSPLQLQSMSTGVNTCGRHVICRLRLAHLNHDQYGKLMLQQPISPDDIVTMLTLLALNEDEQDVAQMQSVLSGGLLIKSPPTQPQPTMRPSIPTPSTAVTSTTTPVTTTTTAPPPPPSTATTASVTAAATTPTTSAKHSVVAPPPTINYAAMTTVQDVVDAVLTDFNNKNAQEPKQLQWTINSTGSNSMFNTNEYPWSSFEEDMSLPPMQFISTVLNPAQGALLVKQTRPINQNAVAAKWLFTHFSNQLVAAVLDNVYNNAYEEAYKALSEMSPVQLWDPELTGLKPQMIQWHGSQQVDPNRTAVIRAVADVRKEVPEPYEQNQNATNAQYIQEDEEEAQTKMDDDQAQEQGEDEGDDSGGWSDWISAGASVLGDLLDL